jgi:hypothetical protein
VLVAVVALVAEVLVLPYVKVVAVVVVAHELSLCSRLLTLHLQYL